MIEISFEIAGEEVFIDQLENDVERETLRQMKEEVKTALLSVRCPKHWLLPKVAIKGETIDDLYFEVQGCCESLIDKALVKIGANF